MVEVAVDTVEEVAAVTQEEVGEDMEEEEVRLIHILTLAFSCPTTYLCFSSGRHTVE